MRWPLSIRYFLTGTIAVGVGLVVVAARSIDGAPRATFALLAAAVILGELLFVSGTQSLSGEVNSDFSFSTGVHLAAVLLLGPLPAVLIAVFGVLVVDPLRGEEIRKMAFNASMFAISTCAGGVAFELAGGQPGQLNVTRDLLAIAALGMTYWTVNTFLVSGVLAESGRVRLFDACLERFRPNLSQFAEAGLGVTLATLVLSQPWVVIALAPVMLAVHRAHERLSTLRRDTTRALETLADLVDQRDPYTFEHSLRVSAYVQELAGALGFRSAAVARLGRAGRLHDLGKIAIDSATLRKQGPLDAMESALLHKHPRLSARLIRGFRLADEEASAVEYHHERYDGDGYYGVDRDDIPLAAHFLIVADSYDAMTTDRPYRAAVARETALDAIEQGLGTQFHPAVGAAFVAFQRGEDPAASIGRDQIEELRRAGRRPLVRIPPAVCAPEGAIVSGLFSALVAFAFGYPIIAAVAAVVAALGVGALLSSCFRSRRLAKRLGVIAACHRTRAFELLLECLAAAGHLRWAGVLSWDDKHLEGSVELERGINSGPTASGLSSWLGQGLEANAEQVVIDHPVPGGSGVRLALRLRRDGHASDFLVLVFRRPPRRHVVRALTSAREALAEALATPAPAPSPKQQRLAAVS